MSLEQLNECRIPNPEDKEYLAEVSKPIDIRNIVIGKNSKGQFTIKFETKNHKYLKVFHGVSSSHSHADGSYEYMSRGIELETPEKYYDPELEFEVSFGKVILWLTPETQEENELISGVACATALKWEYGVVFVEYEDIVLWRNIINPKSIVLRILLMMNISVAICLNHNAQNKINERLKIMKTLKFTKQELKQWLKDRKCHAEANYFVDEHGDRSWESIYKDDDGTFYSVLCQEGEIYEDFKGGVCELKEVDFVEEEIRYTQINCFPKTEDYVEKLFQYFVGYKARFPTTNSINHLNLHDLTKDKVEVWIEDNYKGGSSTNQKAKSILEGFIKSDTTQYGAFCSKDIPDAIGVVIDGHFNELLDDATDPNE